MNSFLFYSLWFCQSTRNYAVDLINFNTDFTDKPYNNFQCRFNPHHPVVFFKFSHTLWVVLLPGKFRDIQGQVLYQLKLNPTKSRVLETCQWSPDGSYLLVLEQFMLASAFNSDLGHRWDASLMSSAADNVLKPRLFHLKKCPTQYRFNELAIPINSLPKSRHHHQLSSKLKCDFLNIANYK